MSNLAHATKGDLKTRILQNEIDSVIGEILCFETLYNEEDRVWHRAKMKEVYATALNSDARNLVPNMSELMDEVMEFNTDRIMEVAYLDFDYQSLDEGYFEMVAHILHDDAYGNTEEDRGQHAQEALVDIWMEELMMMNMGQNDYIDHMMTDLGLSYVEDTLYMHDEDGEYVDTTLLINDCQNLLLPDIHFFTAHLSPELSPENHLNYFFECRFLS